MVTRTANKGDARHVPSDRTGVLLSPPVEKRSSSRATQRNDVADDMTRLNEFQALNDEELDSVSGDSAALLGATRFHNANSITHVRRKNAGGSKLSKKFSITELEPGQTGGLKWKKADRHRSGGLWYRSSLSYVAVMLCGVPARVAWTCALRPSARWISGQTLPVF